VVEDGYRDLSASKLGDHRPAGPWRGGKNTAFEGGTRVPLILHWPGRVKTGVSPALVCHLDFLASFAALIGEELPVGAGADSFDLLPAFLGRTKEGRSHLVEQGDVLALRQDEWKFILAGRPAKKSETNNAPEGWLFRLDRDPGETNNLAAAHTNQLATMLERLLTLRDSSSAR
jgi:arylsulfatase A-like enzyme